jgi:protein-tyrosine phosphatase
LGPILHICMANQIRSPMAALMMTDMLRRRHGSAAEALQITSAGLRAIADQPLHPFAAAELDRRAIPYDGFSSTHFQPAMAAEASLVLAATRLHRDTIVSRAPEALHHTFTWREFAYLMSATPDSGVPGEDLAVRVANMTELARRRRGYARGLADIDLDVADPMGGSSYGYGRAARQIAAAISAIVAVI